MKAIITLAIVFFAAGAFAGSIYDEREDIKKEVTARYDAVITYSGKVAAEVEAEKGKTEQAAADEAKNAGNDKSTAVLTKLDKEVIATTRSAIARGKPVQAIECIAKVSVEGKKLVADTLEGFTKTVDEVKTNREKELEMEKLHIDLIKKGTEELKAESVKKIEDNNAPNNTLKTLKADALKKAGTAYKQLQDIESRILKPVLKERYLALRKGVDPKFNEVQDGLIKRLQKCLG